MVRKATLQDIDAIKIADKHSNEVGDIYMLQDYFLESYNKCKYCGCPKSHNKNNLGGFA